MNQDNCIYKQSHFTSDILEQQIFIILVFPFSNLSIGNMFAQAGITSWCSVAHWEITHHKCVICGTAVCEYILYKYYIY